MGFPPSRSAARLLIRLRCLWLALTMPGEGLAETLEDLRDTREFHKIASVPGPPPIHVRNIPLKLVRVYTRPPFVIEEDE